MDGRSASEWPFTYENEDGQTVTGRFTSAVHVGDVILGVQEACGSRVYAHPQGRLCCGGLRERELRGDGVPLDRDKLQLAAHDSYSPPGEVRRVVS